MCTSRLGVASSQFDPVGIRNRLECQWFRSSGHCSGVEVDLAFDESVVLQLWSLVNPLNPRWRVSTNGRRPVPEFCGERLIRRLVLEVESVIREAGRVQVSMDGMAGKGVWRY